MKEKSRESLFYRSDVQKRYVAIGILGVMILLGAAFLAWGGPREAAADSDTPLNLASYTAQSSEGIKPLFQRSSVVLEADGETTNISFVGRASVEDILKKAGITLSDHDMVSRGLAYNVEPNDTIKVTRVEILEEEVETVTEFQTVEVEDDTLTEGETKVKQEGKDRVEKEIYEVIYHDGEEFKKSLKSTEVIEEGQEEIILIGTAQPTATASDGTSFTYSDVLTCTAYAYVAGGYGASGNPAVPGTVAVDPSVIPLGTRLYVEGYGYAVANDTGGNIIGHTLDLVMDTAADCYRWGRRTVSVYILD